MIWKRFALSTLALGLLVTCAASPTDRTRAEAVAWTRARLLARAPVTWKRPPVIWHEFSLPTHDGGLRDFGYYQASIHVDPDGSFRMDERIDIFVTQEEFMEYYEKAVLHEFLHAIYIRLSILSAEFTKQNPDSESWVRSLE